MKIFSRKSCITEKDFSIFLHWVDISLEKKEDRGKETGIHEKLSEQLNDDG
jgi:hypothetical protein